MLTTMAVREAESFVIVRASQANEPTENGHLCHGWIALPNIARC